MYLGILGTKEYRKPEWVTHMEEHKSTAKGIRELLDETIRVIC